ncbi:MAG TPA: glutamine synthetase [Candidatus Eisenbacteria bacterium]|nr:glutamine synthetase [Candidatus Eisenbacteria bacterium]
MSVFPASKLERILGKSSAEWSADDLVRAVDEENLGLVTLMHVGGDGSLKALDFVPRSRAHLAEILLHGERADGSSLFDGLPTGASDILLRPRLSTAFLNPFSPIPSLALLCAHLDREGKPLPPSPDTIVRRAYDRVRDELGVEYLALGEVEYFLGRPAGDADLDRRRDRGYHATSPFVAGESMRRRAVRHLADMGVPVKYAHAEVGLIDEAKDKGRVWEQHEIELGLAPLPEAADAIVLTRWLLLNLAREEGLVCRFDPILKEGHAGSGLHIHSLPRSTSGAASEAAFLDDGSVGPSGRWLIGGLVQLAPALMAFGNREAASFVRLLQAKETPVAISWGAYNRKALIRLPLVSPSAGPNEAWPPTIEFRLPDGSALPHLLLAGMAQALVLGRGTRELDALLARTSSHGGDIDVSRMPQLPRDREGVDAALEQALPALEAGGVFPPSILEGRRRILVR